jgi:hypothetical protein
LNATLLGPLEGLNISGSHPDIQSEVPVQGMFLNAHLVTAPSIDLCGLGGSDGSTATIDVLPAHTLLDIFDFDRILEFDFSEWRWERLVHVCRRWRQIIFAAPLRLHLHLRCTRTTPVRKYLDIWPPLPLAIDYNLSAGLSPDQEDNLLAALENPDRVGTLYLHAKVRALAKLATAFQKPFPMLNKLQLSIEGLFEARFPSGFLGGSMPRLQELHFNAVPFPKLPTLLLSARDLVTLHLSDIPPSGCISPQEMAACLATLTRLTSLSILFNRKFFAALPDPVDPASVTPIVLPALTSINFHGLCEYIEDLVTQIDCPRLKNIDFSYLHPLLGFEVTQLFNFINRSEDPRPPLFGQMDVILAPTEIALNVSHKDPDHIAICLRLSGRYDWDGSHLAQVFSKFSAKLSNMRHLSIGSMGRGPEAYRYDWVQFLPKLLRPFTIMQALLIFGDCVEHVASLLNDEDGQMASDLLPALDLLCIQGLPVSSIAKFCAARRLSGRPVTFVKNQMEFYGKLKLYQGE